MEQSTATTINGGVVERTSLEIKLRRLWVRSEYRHEERESLRDIKMRIRAPPKLAKTDPTTLRKLTEEQNPVLNTPEWRVLKAKRI